MCLAVSVERRSAPPPNIEQNKNRLPNPRGPVLIFTLREDCPARLCPEDLSDPDRYHRRLKEWLLGQK